MLSSNAPIRSMASLLESVDRWLSLDPSVVTCSLLWLTSLLRDKEGPNLQELKPSPSFDGEKIISCQVPAYPLRIRNWYCCAINIPLRFCCMKNHFGVCSLSAFSGSRLDPVHELCQRENRRSPGEEFMITKSLRSYLSVPMNKQVLTWTSLALSMNSSSLWV